MNNNPIGVFDSGLGGLTVLKKIKKNLPNESVIYLGDTARVPYGTRSKDTIINFAKEDAKFLLKKDVKALVIACNTASSYAYEVIKAQTQIPVFDVITGTAKEAVEKTKIKKITVIGTKATIKSNAYQTNIKKICEECTINLKACPLFVPLIEEGEIKGDIIDLAAKKYLTEFKDKQDVLIMGCTHYPIVKKVIQNNLGRSVKLIDPGKVTATKLRSYLEETDLLSKSEQTSYQYFLTDIGPGFKKVAEIFLEETLDNVNKVELI